MLQDATIGYEPNVMLLGPWAGRATGADRAARAESPRCDLAAVVARRLRKTPASPLLLGRRAVTVLDDGAERATVTLVDGRLSVRPGSAPRADTVVRADPELLRAVVAGETSGVWAFLEGGLTVRGDLSLALALDGLFQGERPVEHPRASLVVAGGVPTAYLDSGPRDAPAVVLLHGLGATNASMLPLQWDLGRDYRVIAPDLPGFGASGKPRGRYDAAWFTRWLLGLRDALDLDQPVLIGNSMGGRIALEAGLRAPDCVGGLVMLSAAPAFRRLRQWVPVVRLLRPEFGRAPIPLPRGLAVEGLRSMFSDSTRLPDEWLEAAVDEFQRVWATPRGRYAFLSCVRQIYLEQAYGDRGFWDRLPRLRTPALFLWGDRDILVPAAFSRHVATALPEAGSVVLEDCGHVPQFEHPELVAEMVRGFLADLFPDQTSSRQPAPARGTLAPQAR